jgi:hypothetical protein
VEEAPDNSQAPEANPADNPPPPPEPPAKPPQSSGEDDPESHIVTPEDLEGLKTAAKYLLEAGPDAFTGVLWAAAKGEPIGDEPENIAASDRAPTAAEMLQLEHGIEIASCSAALEATGVKLGDNPFIPNLQIKDGEKFAAALTAIPTDDQEARLTVESIITASVNTIAFNHIPVGHPEHETNHLHPKLLPGVAESETKLRAHAALTAEVVLHAPAIASELKRLGTDEGIIATLGNARIADAEGMLPYWAVAKELDLYEPPAQNPMNSEWTQWFDPKSWETFHEFIDQVATVAQPGSRFLNSLASTMITNITRFRKGDLVSSMPEPRSDTEPAPEPSGFPEETIPPYPLSFNILLNGAERKLRQIINR